MRFPKFARFIRKHFILHPYDDKIVTNSFGFKLVKTIEGKDGFVYFKRWRWLNFGLFYIDVHEFFLPEPTIINPNPSLRFDKDDYLHNHPRVFMSLILNGGYIETIQKNKNSNPKDVSFTVGDVNIVGTKPFHKIKELFKNLSYGKYYASTLVITTRDIKSWGYLKDGEVISNDEYRAFKYNKNQSVEKLKNH